MPSPRSASAKSAKPTKPPKGAASSKRTQRRRDALSEEAAKLLHGEIERATAMPSLATASKLAEALDLSLSHLLSQVENSNHDNPEQENR